MRILAGTSGYSFPEWKGVFYPDKLPAKKMLGYYAERLPTVEINNTFYRLPKPEVVESWREQVPLGFRFVLKASQRITHHGRLKGVEETLEYFLSSAGLLGERLGALLFQLPPNLRKDRPRLEAFLELLPAGTRAAFEFRHPSWFEDDEVSELLASRDLALVLADTGDAGQASEPQLPRGTSWGYLRLRREDYAAAEIDAWRERLLGQAWSQAFVFFKHEVQGPAFASALLGSSPWT